MTNLISRQVTTIVQASWIRDIIQNAVKWVSILLDCKDQLMRWFLKRFTSDDEVIFKEVKLSEFHDHIGRILRVDENEREKSNCCEKSNSRHDRSIIDTCRSILLFQTKISSLSTQNENISIFISSKRVKRTAWVRWSNAQEITLVATLIVTLIGWTST